MIRKIFLLLGILAALMLPSETFAKHGGGGHGGGHGHGGGRHVHHGGHVHGGRGHVHHGHGRPSHAHHGPSYGRGHARPSHGHAHLDMAAGTTVTGTPATVVGGVATTTRTVLVPAGALRPLVGFGSATRACTHKTFLPPAKMFVFRRRPNGPRRLLLRPRGR